MGLVWQGILIFVRSYFDFVRLRNFLKKEDANVALNHEYLDPRDVNRARSYFYNGDQRIMLVTERAHFFRRQRIRGIRDVFFYSLPDR
jgi:U3 small nucleolar RNA-associated protein 25